MKLRELKPVQMAWLFAAANLVWRLLWLPVSQGAYTDGILQINSFKYGLTYWPPLYTVLAHAFAWIPGIGLEGSARLICVIAGSIAVIPIELIARKFFGARAALWTCLLYTVSPVPLRWSLQVMTDAPFMALWMGSLAAATMACIAVWPELFEQGEQKSAVNYDRAGLLLLLASLAGLLASLTRYQGVFLLPLLIVIALRINNHRIKAGADSGPVRVKPFVALAPWIVLVIWALVAGRSSLSAHADQIAGRTGGSAMATLGQYWFLFEQFVITSPYFLTYGIFGYFIYGLLRINFKTRRLRNGVIAAALLTLGVLALQSTFQAFQSRYMLPCIPFLLIIAGHGIKVWENICKERHRLFYGMTGAALGFAVVWSTLVAFYQGGPFNDVKQAGAFIKSKIPEEARVYGLEFYGARFLPAKLEFWSGHKIERYGGQPLNIGDYIVLSSFYGAVGLGGGGGWAQYQGLLDQINKRDFDLAELAAVNMYPAKRVARFAYSTYPLFPDLMQEPLTHTNPLAWYLRYRRQQFETVVLKVVTVEEFEKGGSGAPAPDAVEGEPAAQTDPGA